MEKEYIRKLICQAYKEVFQKNVPDGSVNLMDPSLGNSVITYLYMFQRLEKELQRPIVQLFETNSYEIMTVDRLTKAIVALVEDE